MALIPTNKPSALAHLGDPPPKGTYLAVCLDTIDQYNVERRKYQSEETEIVNLTRFVFGVKAKDGKTYKIATKAMKISGHENSALYGFLSAWNNEPPKAGFDTAALKGKGAQISVVVNEKDAKSYHDIATIGPVLDELADKVPSPDLFPAGPAQDADEDIAF
jgi:hypothetical protein